MSLRVRPEPAKWRGRPAHPYNDLRKFGAHAGPSSLHLLAGGPWLRLTRDLDGELGLTNLTSVDREIYCVAGFVNTVRLAKRTNDPGGIHLVSVSQGTEDLNLVAAITRNESFIAERVDIWIGTAGWSIPRNSAARFASVGTHLQRYSRRLQCAEINSSFHRPHAAVTYAKWRDSTPAGFRFAVKMPRVITHDLKLRGARDSVVAFLDQTSGLGEKRGPLLVQLPPSLAFDAAVALQFFDLMRAVYVGPLVCEPRHPTWFSPEVAALLTHYRVSRVGADPSAVPEAAVPGGWTAIAYYRLHGSPRTYWSRYDEDALQALAEAIRQSTVSQEIWCIFDNTASGAALGNAADLHRLVTSDGDDGRAAPQSEPQG